MTRQYNLNRSESEGKSQTSAQSVKAGEYHLAILEALADGVDPFSGEVLPNESIFQQSKVMQALQFGVAAVKKQNEKEAKRSKLPPKAGNPWSDEEDKRLLDAFDEGVTPKRLAKTHGRTLGAIQSRLMKKGRI